MEYMLIDVMMRVLEDILFVVYFFLFTFYKIASVINQQNDFIYRLESDTQSGNLADVIDFCSELGGYPIYANNTYEWQLIQGHFFNLFIDTNFRTKYRRYSTKRFLKDGNPFVNLWWWRRVFGGFFL
jgi:hypothetical protein